MLCSSLSLVPRGAPASTHLDSRQDLLGRFGLIPSYDLYVRPYVRPANVSIDKGKTKDTPQEVLDGTNHRIPHGLKSFLADLPGKTSTKKSESLADLMLAAPKQRIEIAPFDSRILENFRLPAGQVPHRANQQIPGADEMRKKKKKPHTEDGLAAQSNATIKLQEQSIG